MTASGNRFIYKRCFVFQLRFKQRIYRSSKIDEKQFKAINTRANLRRLLEYVHNGQVEKVTKLCSKGLDPNFHCVETGGDYYFSS